MIRHPGHGWPASVRSGAVDWLRSATALAAGRQETGFLPSTLWASTITRSWSGAIYDLYVGPESVPTPFEDFWRELDLNPYIGAHGARNRKSIA
jgi:hypothetical protein